MEETSSEDINKFIQIFSKLSSISRREAIRELISTLNSDELDMIIEVIDNKIDDTAAKAGDSRSAREVETDNLEDSGVSSISPSETTCDKDEEAEMDVMFYPSVQIEESSHTLPQTSMYQCPFALCEFETKWTSYLIRT